MFAFDPLFTEKFFAFSEEKSTAEIEFAGLKKVTSKRNLTSFLKSREGKTFKKAFGNAITDLRKWAKAKGIYSESFEKDLKTFESNYLDGKTYFSKSLYTEGIPLFIDLVILLQSNSLPDEICKSAIKNMVADFTKCAEGAHGHIVRAHQKLLAYKNLSAMWVTFRREQEEQLINEIIYELNEPHLPVEERIPGGSFVHYIVAVLNAHHEKIKIPPIEDEYAEWVNFEKKEKVEKKFLEKFASQITCPKLIDYLYDHRLQVGKKIQQLTKEMQLKKMIDNINEKIVEINSKYHLDTKQPCNKKELSQELKDLLKEFKEKLKSFDEVSRKYVSILEANIKATEKTKAPLAGIVFDLHFNEIMSDFNDELSIYGADERFYNADHIFELNEDNTQIAAHWRARSTIVLSLLERLSLRGELDSSKVAKLENLNAATTCHYFPSYSLEFSYVEINDSENKKRCQSFITYFIDNVLLDSELIGLESDVGEDESNFKSQLQEIRSQISQFPETGAKGSKKLLLVKEEQLINNHNILLKKKITEISSLKEKKEKEASISDLTTFLLSEKCSNENRFEVVREVISYLNSREHAKKEPKIQSIALISLVQAILKILKNTKISAEWENKIFPFFFLALDKNPVLIFEWIDEYAFLLSNAENPKNFINYLNIIDKLSKEEKISLLNKLIGKSKNLLLFLLKNKYSEMVELLLEYGEVTPEHINQINDQGVTALTYAVENEDQEMVDLLLNKGADPYVSLPSGQTFFLMACEKGYFDIAKKVYLDAGSQHKIDLDQKNNDYSEMTALMYAAKYNNIEMVRFLLQHEANPFVGSQNTPALIYAIRVGNWDMVKLFLDNDSRSFSMLLASKSIFANVVHEGKLEILKSLREYYNAKFYQHDNNKPDLYSKILSLAISGNHLDIALYLLSLPEEDSMYNTIQKEISENFISLLADAIDKFKNLEIIQKLMDRKNVKKDLNQSCPGKAPLIFIAVRHNCTDIVSLLLKKGIDLKVKYGTNKNEIIDYVFEQKIINLKIMELLLDYSSRSINFKHLSNLYNDQNTDAIMVLLKTKKIPFVLDDVDMTGIRSNFNRRFNIEESEDFENKISGYMGKNPDYKSPLSLAIIYGYSDAVKWLIKTGFMEKLNNPKELLSLVTIFQMLPLEEEDKACYQVIKKYIEFSLLKKELVDSKQQASKRYQALCSLDDDFENNQEEFVKKFSDFIKIDELAQKIVKIEYKPSKNQNRQDNLAKLKALSDQAYTDFQKDPDKKENQLIKMHAEIKSIEGDIQKDHHALHLTLFGKKVDVPLRKLTSSRLASALRKIK